MSAIEWKKICCPVDVSEPAREGLRVAADLCRRLGSELVLLNADGGTKVADELPPEGPVEGKLDSWKQEAQRLGAAQVTAFERAEGPPEVAIAEFASAEGIDLIVMGTHGRVDREHMLTGSVAEGVVRLAGCPVLTARPTSKP